MAATYYEGHGPNTIFIDFDANNTSEGNENIQVLANHFGGNNKTGQTAIVANHIKGLTMGGCFFSAMNRHTLFGPQCERVVQLPCSPEEIQHQGKKPDQVI